MCVGLCCENGQGYPVWFQSNAFSHFSHKLSIIFLPAFEKENCGSSFQYPSHREMGFWCGDVEGTAIRKGFYTSAISSVQNMYDLTFYIWWECYYFQVAEMLQIPLGEVSVRWQEIDGSKLSPLLAAIEMFRLPHLTSHVTNWWYLLFSGIFSCCGWDMLLAPGEFQRRKPDCSCIWDPDEEGPWFNNLFCLTKKLLWARS